MFGPCKTSGERQTLMYSGKGVEGISTVVVDVAKLRKTRRQPDTDKGTFMKKPGLYAIR